MTVIRTLWASIQGDPVFMRKLNGWLTIQWLIHFPVVIGLYFLLPDIWKQVSILYLALVSIYANAAGHLAAWQAARIEVAQNEEDIPREVARELKDDPEVPV